MQDRVLFGMSAWSKVRAGLMSGTAIAGVVFVGNTIGARPALAACDANTAGVSVCSGTDASVTKTATGNLDVQFNNETVTTSGVTISGGAGGFNVDLNVTSATGPNPITSGGTGVTISSNGGNVGVNTIAGANISGVNGGINASIVGGTGSTSITVNGNVSAGIGPGISAVSGSTGSISNCLSAPRGS